MKGKQIFYWLSVFFFLFAVGCNSGGEDEVIPDEGTGDDEEEVVGDRDVWSFDIKVMLDRKTFMAYLSSEKAVNDRLQQRFEEVRELYHGKAGITYFDADIEFVPFFDETCVYDCSSEEVFRNALSYRGDYPYLVIFDGCIGDFSDERVHSDWTGWGTETVCVFDNNKGGADGGSSVYEILSYYKTAECLAHELGHARGVPDIYAMEVTANPVNGELFSPVTCIMNNCWGGTVWSEYAQLLINRNKDLVRGEEGFVPLEQPQYPEEVILKVTRNGEAVKYATVNIYREAMYEYNIASTPAMVRTLGADGSVSLNPTTLFNASYGGVGYGVLLIEVVDGSAKEYRMVPVYEVQIAYLKGETNEYTIEIEFE